MASWSAHRLAPPEGIEVTDDQIVPTDGRTVRIRYTEDGGLLTLWHIEVPPAARGQGIARGFAEQVLDWLDPVEPPVRITCSYMRGVAARR